MKIILKTTLASLLLTVCLPVLAQAKKEAPVEKTDGAVENIAMPKDAAQRASYKQRMITAVASAMPVGKIMADVAANDPYWPSSKARNPNPTKLSCMRNNLKEEGYRKVLTSRVETYSADHGDRFGSDLALMEGEGAKLFSKVMMAGARSATNGENTEVSALLKDASPRGMLDLMRLARDPEFAPLRGLMGMEGEIGSDEKTGKEIGENAGMTMMLPMLVDAMEICKVKMDEL